MFLLSNVVLLLKMFCDKNWNQCQNDTPIISGVNGLLIFIYAGFLSAAHWMFSYEYYNMVRIIPFVLDDIAPPESIMKSNRVQFWLWSVLNTLTAFLAGVSYYVYCVDGYDRALMMFSILVMIISLLDVISAFYLGVSIYRIKKLISDKQLQVNTKIMVVQAATFTLYLFSILVFCFAFEKTDFLFTADMLYNFCSSLA